MFTLEDLHKMATDVDTYYKEQGSTVLGDRGALQVAHKKLWSHFNNYKFLNGRMFSKASVQTARQQGAVDYCMIHLYAYQCMLATVIEKVKETCPGANVRMGMCFQIAEAHPGILWVINTCTIRGTKSTEIHFGFYLDFQEACDPIFPSSEIDFDNLLAQAMKDELTYVVASGGTSGTMYGPPKDFYQYIVQICQNRI